MAQADTIDHHHDLALAAELQAALLPKQCPSDCPHQVAAARNRMCGSVGGDFYDFIRINEDQVALVIGDVVGHGIRAALLMAQIMGYLRSEPEKRSRPPSVVAALNRMLIDLGEKTGLVIPCSLFYAVIDAPTGTGFFVNAGHPRPFLYNTVRRSVPHFGPHDFLLGVQEFEPTEGCHTFTPGQRLILYTDGITDALNPSGERFGEKRLREVINRNAGASADQCAEAVFRAVDEFTQGAEQQDDETIVVIDRV